MPSGSFSIQKAMALRWDLAPLLVRGARPAASAGGRLPSVAQPSAVGEPGHCPLIQLPDGTLENAPQLSQ